MPSETNTTVTLKFTFISPIQINNGLPSMYTRVLDAIKGLVSSVKSKVSSSKWLKYFGLKGKMVSAVDGIKSKLDDAATALKRKIDEVIGKVEAACFVAGTKILTNKGYKSIENVSVGDIVLARDEVSGQIDYKPVNQVFVNRPKRSEEIR